MEVKKGRLKTFIGKLHQLCCPSRRKQKKHEDVEGLYEFGEEIGRGAFSISVLKAKSKERPNEEYAIKVIDTTVLSDRELHSIESEVSALQTLSHPNIVRLERVIRCKTRLYLILEFLSGGSLHQKMVSSPGGIIPEPVVSRIIREIFLAVSYMHSLNFIHRDISPNNILFSSSDHQNSGVKLSDFGFCTKIEGSQSKFLLRDPCGTPAFCAPEILSDKPYDKSIDIWSIGALAFTLLYGYPPFFDDDPAKLCVLANKGQIEFPSESVVNVSCIARDFISLLLHVNPQERPNAQQALLHPWLVDQGNQSVFIGSPPFEIMSPSPSIASTSTLSLPQASNTPQQLYQQQSANNAQTNNEKQKHAKNHKKPK